MRCLASVKRIVIFVFVSLIVSSGTGQTYKVVDTGQSRFYDNMNEISAPSSGEAFYGQDAQFSACQPSYTDNGNGTVTDNVSGLMWTKGPDLNADGTIDINDKLTYRNALAGADTLTLAGYDDWRLPTIKELYSLIMFYGLDPSGYTGSTDNLVPFINTSYFDFGYGDETAGERIIDAQFATSTKYVSTTMDGNETMFGVNFADGRIKGYPAGATPVDPDGKGFYVLYVRGNTAYGKNNFRDNGNGTVTDLATGLMWSQADNGQGVNWQDALAWVQQKNSENYLGHSNWRLPNVKELQSIVDYTRSPATTNSAAIDPVFSCTAITDEGGNQDYPFYWSSTTHANPINGGNAAYVAFGEALGWMEMPPNSGNYTLMDVHGAGAQRSDPKTGDPADWPYGHGPQGDVIRIYNFVRLVRDANTATGMNESQKTVPQTPELDQNYPNPFNPSTNISFSIPQASTVLLTIYDVTGQESGVLANDYMAAGHYTFSWDATGFAGGIYFSILRAGEFVRTRKMLLVR